MVKSFNHIGICVNNIDETFKWMEKAFGAKMLYKHEYPDRHQVSAMVVLADEESKIELMEPLGEGGTVNDFLQKKGQGIHHISLKVDDLDKTCDTIEKAGGRIIGKVKGIAFIHPKTSSGVLYELSDGTFSKKE